MTDPEELLAQALHRRVEDTTHDPTPLREVLATAHGIRRRQRRRAVLAVAAAVVVVTVPAAVVLGTGDAPAQNRPTGPPPWVTERQSSPPVVKLEAVAQGAPPRVAYLDGRDFVSAEGNRTTLPLDVRGATPYHGGFLVALPATSSNPQVALLDNELREVWRRCGQGGFALSNDGVQTAYTTAACDDHVATVHLGLASGMSDLEQSQDLPVDLSIPVGVLGGAVVLGSLPGDNPHVATFSGPLEPIQALGSAEGVSEQLGLVSGQLAGNPRTGAVVDPESGEVAWVEPGWYVERFSPDGTHVLAVRGGDGRPLAWRILDAASGDVRHEFGLPAGLEEQAVTWEDDDHLLMVVTQGSQQAIIRTTLDGEISRATEVAVAADADTPTYRFAAHP
jgi:hypothetical protein